MKTGRDETPADISPDRDDRIADFLSRHGGPRGNAAEGESQGGQQGWSEIYAMDGYTLRCDWSRMGSKDEMAYTEIPPAQLRGT